MRLIIESVIVNGAESEVNPNPIKETPRAIRPMMEGSQALMIMKLLDHPGGLGLRACYKGDRKNQGCQAKGNDAKGDHCHLRWLRIVV